MKLILYGKIQNLETKFEFGYREVKEPKPYSRLEKFISLPVLNKKQSSENMKISK